MEWDDLKLVLAVADHGSIKAAAQHLKIQPQELGRRIQALESAWNCELVAADGATITASGQRAIEVARDFSTKLAALAKELGGERGEVSGTITVTAVAGFVPRALQAFDRMRAKYPSLAVEVLVSMNVVDLRRKEADLAIRMFRDQQDGLGMHKLGTMGWSLYASAKYLAGHTAGASLLDGHKVIAYDSSFSNTAGGRWLAANAPAESIAMHVGGVRQAFDAAAAHQGVCVAPCYLAKEHNVVRVTDQVLTTNEVYAVYLAERTSEARMRVVIDALVDLFAREQATFAGTS